MWGRFELILRAGANFAVDVRKGQWISKCGLLSGSCDTLFGVPESAGAYVKSRIFCYV